jgi:hypothetical protein
VNEQPFSDAQVLMIMVEPVPGPSKRLRLGRFGRTFSGRMYVSASAGEAGVELCDRLVRRMSVLPAGKH